MYTVLRQNLLSYNDAVKVLAQALQEFNQFIYNRYFMIVKQLISISKL